jgi:hypothetical protein
MYVNKKRSREHFLAGNTCIVAEPAQERVILQSQQPLKENEVRHVPPWASAFSGVRSFREGIGMVEN